MSVLQKWKQLSGSEKESMGTGQGLSFSLLNAAGSYLDWLLMAHNPEDGSLRMEEVPVKELLCEEEKRQLEAMEAALDRARQYDELYAFITGFRLGGALTREAFADIDELVDYRERHETLED